MHIFCSCSGILLGSSVLFADELIYEPASGKNYGFDLSHADTPDTPASYTSIPNLWQTKADGFVGRLRYQGPKTRLTFTQTAPIAQETVENMFYFTYLTDGTARLDTWREYFIVTTVKGLLHNGKQDAFLSYNTPIYQNGGSVAIPVSSGPDTWDMYDRKSHPGFTSYGASGLKTWGSNVFAYKHKYQYTWVDIVLIKRDKTRPVPFPAGMYVSRFTTSTTEGLSESFALFGENNPEGIIYDFFFEIKSIVPKFFPYEMLREKNTVQNSLHVANLTYYSLTDAANLRIASDAAGSAANFNLYSPGVPPIPFEVVFTSTVPQGSPVHITSPYTTFDSVSKTSQSPIDDQMITANFLDGKLSIFVTSNTLRMSGNYSGSVYCIITQQ